MNTFFPVETYDEKYMIEFFIEEGYFQGEPNLYFTSSYHVVASRILGFSYPDYLRYCRSHGAALRGKQGYSFPVWIDKNECQKICNLLNKEWDKLKSLIQFAKF